jgi:D-3-phosphoglycerate dehydrogenase
MKTIPDKGAAGIAPDLSINPLILDLLDWLAPEPRPYAEVMEAWRTSCPRLPVWEDAVERGLVVRRRDPDAGPAVVALTTAGRQMIKMRAQRA